MPGTRLTPGSRAFATRGREEKKLRIYIDTCVLPRSRLETGRIYRNRFGAELGFELLMMFDLPDFEDSLKRNRDLFAQGPLLFHEPVWGVDHAAPRGSVLYEEGMRHIRLTQKWARILRPEAMVCHFNNSPVPPGGKDRMLRAALENLEEMRLLFPDVRLLVENTGTKETGTVLLDQEEFTALCLDRRWPVLIDVGHANANGWDMEKLMEDLRGLIGGFHLHNNDGVRDLHRRLRDGTADFGRLVPYMDRTAPDAPRVIEYTDPVYHGEALMEDIAYLKGLSEKNAAGRLPARGRNR